jgi:hypothetical protein
MAYKINSIENWRKWETWFRENGWKPWQYQDDNGFHVWISKSGEKDIEIVTFNEEVRKEIMKFPAT